MMILIIIIIIIIIIMGDFNTKLGNKEYLKPVAGPNRLHDCSNENGNMLIQFVIGNRLIVKSKIFHHKHIYLGTWRISGCNEVNQIDRVLATSHHSSSVIDFRSCRGTNCDSDYYLVRIKMRERIANVRRTPRRKARRWDAEKLQKGTAQREECQKLQKGTAQREECQKLQKGTAQREECQKLQKGTAQRE